MERSSMMKHNIPDLIILIVDDDDFQIRELTALILHDRHLQIGEEVRSKITILNAKNGAEALAILQQNRKVNLILLDIVMPIMDGYEICKILRRNPEWHHCVDIPIFFISGAIKDTQEQLRGIELEADEVFSKPFDPMLLGSYIKKELKRQIVAYQHELAIRSRRLIAQIQERAQKQNTFHFVSSHTYSHSARVEVLSSLIGSSPVLNLSEGELFDLKEMVRDHDKGKIGIPEEILNKPNLLSEREVSIIQMHTAISSFLINAETTESFSPAVYGELFHHEKYLGGGYPTGRPLFVEEVLPATNGKSALRLHLLLSIVNCSDALDALTSKRPYKEAASLLAASRILVTHSYTHFDPLVIEALFERLSSIDEAALKRIDGSATKKSMEYYRFFKEVFHQLRQTGFARRVRGYYNKQGNLVSYIQELTTIRSFWFEKVLRPCVDAKVAENYKSDENQEMTKHLGQAFREAKQPLAKLSAHCPFLYAAAYLELGCSYRFLEFADIESLKEEVLRLIPNLGKNGTVESRLYHIYNACLILFLLQTLYYIEYLDLNNVEHAEYLLYEFTILYELWKKLKKDALCISGFDHVPLRSIMSDLYDRMINECLDSDGKEKSVPLEAGPEKIREFVSEADATWQQLAIR